MLETIQTEIRAGVAYLHFSRPEVRNAVNRRMMIELEDMLNRWEKDPEIQVIVLLGDKKAFASGGDLVDLHQLKKKEEIYPVMQQMGRVLSKLTQMKALTIAAVEGYAVGGGCEIAVSCDWIIASPSAKFGMIQERLGITTGWGGAGRLMRKVGVTRAEYLLLSGEIISAEEAERIGLVDRILVADDWREAIEQLAIKIAAHPEILRRTYQHLASLHREGRWVPEDYLREAESCATLWETERHRLAVEDFMRRKRK